jgi:hypothetical protein
MRVSWIIIKSFLSRTRHTYKVHSVDLALSQQSNFQISAGDWVPSPELGFALRLHGYDLGGLSNHDVAALGIALPADMCWRYIARHLHGGSKRCSVEKTWRTGWNKRPTGALKLPTQTGMVAGTRFQLNKV